MTNIKNQIRNIHANVKGFYNSHEKRNGLVSEIIEFLKTELVNGNIKSIVSVKCDRSNNNAHEFLYGELVSNTIFVDANGEYQSIEMRTKNFNGSINAFHPSLNTSQNYQISLNYE